MAKKSSKNVDAAKARRDRDSREAGAHTPRERQQVVSQPQHKRGVREGRWFGQDPD
ncbi:hypothetical protein AB0N07_46480 [Streptomyces sp. NPDC051172]|uniref:hypothetical protein n=1 Tax=Streptomyces sp. NPDC051172 TaxID=3155796 RepID=UPI003448162A